MLENGAKICSAKALELNILHISVKLFVRGYLHILLYPAVTLYDVNIYLLKITALVFQHRIGLVQKAVYHLTLTGSGGVDGYDKFPDPFVFPVFEWLDEGHILVQFEAVGVIVIVEGIQINTKFFFQHGKFTQKFSVIHFIPPNIFQCVQQMTGLLAPLLVRISLHV